ncbi:MAG: DUF2961 domain-containing protein, partial [Phycisphaerae bacterium]|nr:DUF2961 domain-containing protein [Phycisphaerae bacterium]
MWQIVVSMMMSVVAAEAVPATEPPVIPVGLDAYRLWDRWAYQRIGARSYMRSTYDRSGHNETADASHYLYQEAEDFNVTLDVAGPGVLYFARYNHWHGSPWHYEVDGVDHIVREATTTDPTKKLTDSVFLPESLFPNPLTWTYAITKGADLMWVPIAFEKSFRMAYSRTFYGTGYYIYHQYVPGANLSQPITAWDGKTPPDPAVLELLRCSGDVPDPESLKACRSVARDVPLDAGGTIVLADAIEGPGMIRMLSLTLPRGRTLALERVRMRITWDDRAAPSVDAPLALCFGAGTLYNRDGREHLVKAFPMNIRYDEKAVHLACHFPMPFFKSARIELVGVPAIAEASIRFAVYWAPYADPPNHVGYFHATYQDHPKPTFGQDIVLLDTQTVEGGGDWSGSFVGTSFIFSHNAVLTTLEGDPRFFFDDCQTPSYGTGTEEWGGGGDYWGGLNMTLPLVGHPCGARKAEDAKDPRDLIQSAYRFLLADLMPFGKRAVIRLEHGGENESIEHYETVTYWYGLPGASLVLTDTLDVGDAASERAHAYTSPDASEVVSITSRYEWGPDTLKKKDEAPVEIYPAHTETGRHTTGTSEFTVKLTPDNRGAMLRRTLDYAFPNQRAEVYVADATADEATWEYAGVWYEAGSNTCYHSWPREGGELGPSNPVVQTSNRRFRDSEFLL